MSRLVIFDLDGVLVDSERLAVRTEQAILASMGWSLSEAEIAERFVGRSAEYMRVEVQRAIGRPVDWASEFDPHYVAAFTSELTATEGVTQALEAITAPVCVASSSSHEQIRLKLGLVGLLERFQEAIFSSEDVENPKPAPDVFLHAASQMGVHTRDCVVVEDSTAGCRAGLAAGMRVLGFETTLVPREALEALGVETFSRMSDLARLVGT